MSEIRLGLKENWKQFSLLVLINAFVGGMVGIERTILPEIAVQEFGIISSSAIFSFIIVFGITKAITNYYTGAFANKIGRKNLLTIGWLFALPIPFLLMFANSWNWIIFANVLLGVNQGLTWSSTVVMKIDLVGERDRGFAMGINESSGYIAVGGVAFLTGWIATEFGLRPYPFYLGFIFAVLGLTTSYLFVKDTVKYVNLESLDTKRKKLKKIFLETTILDRNLSSITQAGLINNLNDAMTWGLLPILLISKNFSLETIGIIIAIYPAVWGIGQLITGTLADKYNKKWLLFFGMLTQSFAIALFVFADSISFFVTASILLGAGTALVYPTFLAAISEFTHPEQRAKCIGVFRLWRDLGYAVGAILTGVLADFFGLNSAIIVIGILTFISAIIIAIRMRID